MSKRVFKRIFIAAFLLFIHMSVENGTLKQFFNRFFEAEIYTIELPPGSKDLNISKPCKKALDPLPVLDPDLFKMVLDRIWIHLVVKRSFQKDL